MLAGAVGYTTVAWPAGVAGAAAVALADRWVPAGTLAACAAMLIAGVGIAADTLPLPAAADEGTLILAYLLSLDLAGVRLRCGLLPWIQERGPVTAAALLIALGGEGPASCRALAGGDRSRGGGGRFLGGWRVVVSYQPGGEQRHRTGAILPRPGTGG
jgi:hypothetical protein